jgi:hypothetical protein
MTTKKRVRAAKPKAADAPADAPTPAVRALEVADIQAAINDLQDAINPAVRGTEDSHVCIAAAQVVAQDLVDAFANGVEVSA